MIWSCQRNVWKCKPCYLVIFLRSRNTIQIWELFIDYFVLYIAIIFLWVVIVCQLARTVSRALSYSPARLETERMPYRLIFLFQLVLPHLSSFSHLQHWCSIRPWLCTRVSCRQFNCCCSSFANWWRMGSLGIRGIWVPDTKWQSFNRKQHYAPEEKSRSNGACSWEIC